MSEILVIDLWWHEFECRICESRFALPPSAPSYGVPMYEEYCVPPEWDGEWGGFPCCKECYDKYERRDLPMWTVEQLRHATRKDKTP